METIKRISGREILDSRGWPTLECWLTLSNGQVVTASVPAGASTGKYEAQELRDNEERYQGRGVRKAIYNLENKIAPIIIDKVPDVFALDKLIIEGDGTERKTNFGANAILAASVAIVTAQALVAGAEVFELIARLNNCVPKIPNCMFNILNGGVHGDRCTNFQEFMIIPCKKASFEELLEDVVVIYQQLRSILKRNCYPVGVGDEGGFSPSINGSGVIKERMALDLLMEAISRAGYSFDHFKICLDVAASQLFDENDGLYNIDNEKFTSEEFVKLFEDLVANYPIYSIEDGMAQEDWSGWKILTNRLGEQTQLIGDDIFVTNKKFIEQGFANGVANAVLIKPNQVGTVSEAMQAIDFARSSGYSIVASHRSGETVDSFITDLAVGVGADQFKAGACSRGERVVKYNRLLEIERAMINGIF